MQTEREGVIKLFIYCYVCCNFQQNIPLFFAISDSWHAVFAVNRWRIVSDGNPENCFLFRGRDTGREVTVMRVLSLRVYPTPSPPTWGLSERRKLFLWGLGCSHSRERFVDFLCDFTPLCSIQVLSLKGSKSSLQRLRVTQKQSMFVECWCWNNGNRTETGSHSFVNATDITTRL